MGAQTSNIKATGKGGKNPLSNPKFASLSNFSPAYILTLKERFDHGSEDYCLDEASLKKFFKCSDNEIDTLMEYFDMDQNGSIDSYEFVAALSLLSNSSLDEKAELIFNLYDFDKSKSLEKDEIIVLVTNTLSAMNAMNKKAPPTIKEIEQKLKSFGTQADTNGDGSISLTEFKKYIKKDKQILEALCNFGVAKSDDLGTDFGSGEGGAPDCDSDLEEEINPKALKNSQKKNNVKNGINDKMNVVDEFGDEEVDAGDQFMAVKPWMGVVNNSVPTGYKPNKLEGSKPEAELELDWVHGYRCHDARNNLRYTAGGDIVYHAAGVGVVLNTASHTQKFFMGHNDDIHCLATDPSGKYIATGQIGPKPRLIVWDTTTMQSVQLIVAPLTKGIKTVAFSPNGKYLAASALEDKHTIAVFDWKPTPKNKGKPLAPVALGRGPSSAVLSLGFNASSDQVVATCVKEVQFYTFANGKLQGQKGTGWGTKPAEGVLCQAFVGNTLFTGCYGGDLLAWNGRGISKRTKAHAKRVNCLYGKANGLLSGASDGLIIDWTVQGTALQKKRTIDLKTVGFVSMRPLPISICEKKDSTLLVGTRGGEVIEIKANTPKPVVHVRSHFDGELWGLAIHPHKAEMITFGRDKMLAIWNMKTRRQIKHSPLQGEGDALAFQNSAKHIAIGYLNGQILVLDSTKFQTIASISAFNGKACQILKYTPDDSKLAAGGANGQIILFNVLNRYKPLKKIRGHHSRILHFDFSQDGSALMSNSQDYEILFWDTSSGKQITSGASNYKDEAWHSWSCKLGWPVQGIWPPCANGTDINAVERAPDGTVVATADDFGQVKLFRYPCPQEKSNYQQYFGHSSHVTNISFSKTTDDGQQYLITTGGEDKSIFQWKYQQDAQANEDTHNLMEERQDEDEYGDEEEKGGDDEFGDEEEDYGDEAMAVKPFLGQVNNSVPSNFVETKTSGAKPDVNLKLKWAHGFRSFDTTDNLRYTKDGNVVFTTAGLGVVYDKRTKTQSFYNEHAEDIVAMALHPDGDIVATGQMASKELGDERSNKKNARNKGVLKQGKLVDIRIWRASTCETICKIRGFHRRAVRTLKFSPGGSKLLSIGEDDQHSVAVYDWATQTNIGNAKCDPAKVNDAEWKNETEFATCGVKHMMTFTQNGQNLSGKKGLFSKLPAKTTLLCVQYVCGGTLISGTNTGSIIKWAGNSPGKAVKAHTGPVYVIEKGDANTFYTGGKDGRVLIWDKSITAPKTSIDITQAVTFQPGITALSVGTNGLFLVGTKGSDVVEVDSTGKKKSTIVQGHFAGVNPAKIRGEYQEVWGLCTHPTENKCATAGSDGTIRIWTPERMLLVTQPFPRDITALDWSPNGKYIVAGDRSGTARLLNAETAQVLGVTQHKLGKNRKGTSCPWVQSIKFSPDSTKFAYGCHGGISDLEVVHILKDGKLKPKAQVFKARISSALTFLDWSQDSSIIQVNSQAYELQWISAESGQPVNASSVKDVEWQTWTACFGFPVQGIWTTVDYTDVNATCRSHNGQVIATGNDDQKVRLFKYPCVVENAQHNVYNGHSSHVTNVKFSAGDDLLFTTGGNDKTLLVWETDINAGAAAALDEEDDYGEEDVQQYQDDDEEDYPETKIDFAREEKSRQKKEVHASERAAIQKKFASMHKNDEDDEFGEEEDDAGDEAMAVRPWVGQISAPSGYQKPPKNQTLPPNVNIELEWVHGYRGRAFKNNMAYLEDNSIAYNAAALGITYNHQTKTQSFFDEHHDDVTAVAFSPNKRDVATGENGPKPSVFIYDGISMTKKHEFKLNGIVKGVQDLDFSPSGKFLAIVDLSDDHNLAVYNTDTGACVAKGKGDRGAVACLSMISDTTFVTVGVKHFKQWTVTAGNVSGKAGSFGKNDSRIYSVAIAGGKALTGNFAGGLYQWSGTSITKAQKLHTKVIDAITVTKDHVFCGGRDNKVSVLNVRTFAPLFSFDTSAWPSVAPAPRSISIDSTQKKLAIGTFGSEIFQVQINLTGKALQGQPEALIQGHYAPLKVTNEVWGLCAFANGEKYATSSDDGTIRIWDALKHTQLKCYDLKLDKDGKVVPKDTRTRDNAPITMGRALDVSPKGDFIAVGMKDGTMRVLQVSTGKTGYVGKCAKRAVSDLKFSPNGLYLGVASHDKKLYVYSTRTWKKIKFTSKSSSTINQFDFSMDSESIRTCDSSYEILYYSIEGGNQITSGASMFKDEPWASHACVLGWGVQAIFESGQDNTDVNYAARSNQPVTDGLQLLVTANDSEAGFKIRGGAVKVFRYPCVQEPAQFLHLKGHGSDVTNVRFSANDTYIYSTGGNDTTVMQWRINK